MLSTILIIVAVVIVLLLIVIAMQSSELRLSRSATINAPASKIFPNVNDLHKWGAWSPWEKLDPNTQKTYGGPSAGVGAMYHWQGNSKVGEGQMDILESKPNELVRIKLQFIKPFKGLSTTDFTFKQEGSATVVTQAMYGPKNFLAKAMHMVMNMDKMVGSQFETGLADLKKIAEAS